MRGRRPNSQDPETNGLISMGNSVSVPEFAGLELRCAAHLNMKKRIVILCTLWLALPATSEGWPSSHYREIFLNAHRVLPPPLRQLLVDMDAVFEQPCEPKVLEQSVDRAIAEFSNRYGSLQRAGEALRDAGCAAAAMNDPRMDRLVQSHGGKFPVVFYGYHPFVRDGNLAGYLAIRREAQQRLAGRLERSIELPSRSEQVELSPEFGVASIAFSHAVTDVANVWFYVWTKVNGSVN